MSSGADLIAERRAAFIAVAPVDALPLDPQQARIARGFLEDVIAELARAPDFEVLAARTSLSLPPEALEPRSMAAAFGVTHLLDSAVRPTADGLQVKASLVEASTGRLVWSQAYEAPRRDAAIVLEDIAVRVANHLAHRLRVTRLAQVRSRPLSTLAAQDCWLRGLEALRRSTPDGDEDARQLFQRALSIDPSYGRAYAGLSLSYFKRWNWRHATERETEWDRLSLQYATKGEELDDMDPVVQLVLGRTQVFRRQFGPGRHHLELALELSPNHADCLMEAAPMWAYAGEPERALELTEKAFRLNPLRDPWYYFTAFMPHFVNRRLEVGAAILEQAPPHMIFEQSALLAASYAHLGRTEEARVQIPLFLEEFQRSILDGRPPEPGEAIAHIFASHPFQRKEDLAFLREGLARAGLEEGGAPAVASTPVTPDQGRFVRTGPVWEAAFAGRSARLPDIKGCRDIAILLGAPRERIHCMELAGRVAEGDGGEAMDARARAACQRRIQDLQEDLAEAERHNDYARSERLTAELDAIVEQLSAAMGLRGRSRKLGDPAEKARTAVTWRIRNAIQKIGEVHPELGRHLAASVRTGAFCAYDPERSVTWTTL